MKKMAAIVLVLSVFLIVSTFVLSRKEAVPTGKPTLAATILPVSMILTSIAGEEFSVVTVLPAGASPHTYEPSPGNIGKLKGASVLFSVGHGLDDWSIALAKSAGVANRVVVDANIQLVDDNPHYFLSPVNAGIIAQTIRDELTRLYPEKREIFTQNEIAFAGSMFGAYTQGKDILVKIGNPPLATFHGAWDYFARDFGLTIAAVFEEYPGKEPTPQYLKEFEKQIRESGAKVIYAEPQFGTALLEPIAKDLGVKIALLDPEGTVTGAKTYEELISKNIDEIVKANSK